MKYVVSVAVVLALVLVCMTGCQSASKSGSIETADLSRTAPAAPAGGTVQVQKQVAPSGSAAATSVPSSGAIKLPAATAPAAPVQQGPAPAIVFESTVHNFGDIDPNSKNVAEFKFTNTGKGTLKIGTIQTTCGCTVGSLTKYDYAPGESGTVHVEYHASKMAGQVTKNIFVPSNDPCLPRVELTLKGMIVIKVDAKPESLKLSLFEPNGGAQPVILTSKDGKPFAIKSAESSGNVLTAKFDPAVTATNFVVPLTVDMDKLKSNLNGYIRLNITHPSIDMVTIGYSTPSEFDTQPSSLIIRDAQPGVAVEREVWVKSNYNRPFEIESIISKSGNIKIVKQEKIDNTYKVVISIVPPESQKVMFFADALEIKIKDSAPLTINCRGFYTRKH